MDLIENMISASIGRQRRLRRRGWAAVSQAMIDMYEGNAAGIEFIGRFLSSLYDGHTNKKEIRRFWPQINVLAQIVRDGARVYAAQPIRSLSRNGKPVVESDESAKVFRSIVRNCRLDRALRRAERYDAMLGGCVLHPAPDFGAGRFRWQVLPCAELIVDPGEIDPSDLQSAKAIAVPIGGASESGPSIPKELRFIKYSRAENSVFAEITDADLRPLKRQPAWIEKYRQAKLEYYPIVLAQSEDPQEGDGIFRDVDWSLLTAQLFVAWRWASQVVRYRNKEWEPNVVRGSYDQWRRDNGDSPEIHPSVWIFSEAGVEKGSWDPQAEQYAQFERQFLSALGRSLQLPNSFTEKIVAESGVARWYHELPARRRRQSTLPFWRELEEGQLFAVTVEAARLVGFPDHGLLDDCELSVRHVEIGVELSPKEEMEILERKIRCNVDSAVSYLMRIHGIDEDSARGEVLKMKKYNEANSDKEKCDVSK